MTTVPARATFHWVLAFGAAGLSTPAVYAEIDRLRDSGNPPRLSDPEALLAALSSGDPHALAPLLGNDLQPAALSLMPGLRRTLRAGVEAGALAGIVSGSGPTCAFLCALGRGQLSTLAANWPARVCRTVRVARGRCTAPACCPPRRRG